MGDESGIQWTDATWNPVVGCTKVSAGCEFCYAEKMHERLREMAAVKGPLLPGWDSKYRDRFSVVREWPSALEQPLRWMKPRRIFVDSMSDLFHDDVSDGYIERVFEVMRRADWHTFQVLTKRAERLGNWTGLVADRTDRIDRTDRSLGGVDGVGASNWPSNVWMGVSVEGPEQLGRVAHLQGCGAAVKFLSLEPLLGPIAKNLSQYLEGIDWVIVGGESGARAKVRECWVEWIREVVEVCRVAGVPVFVKQLGTISVIDGKLVGWRHSKGGDMEEWPSDLRVREWPRGRWRLRA